MELIISYLTFSTIWFSGVSTLDLFAGRRLCPHLSRNIFQTILELVDFSNIFLFYCTYGNFCYQILVSCFYLSFPSGSPSLKGKWFGFRFGSSHVDDLSFNFLAYLAPIFECQLLHYVQCHYGLVWICCKYSYWFNGVTNIFYFFS